MSPEQEPIDPQSEPTPQRKLSFVEKCKNFLGQVGDALPSAMDQQRTMRGDMFGSITPGVPDEHTQAFIQELYTNTPPAVPGLMTAKQDEREINAMNAVRNFTVADIIPDIDKGHTDRPDQQI